MRRDRLARLLGVSTSAGRFIFKLGGQGWFRDSEITEVRITRGGDNPIAGITPTVMEITVTGVVPRSQGQLCELVISEPAATALTADTPADPTDVAWRFSGFVGMQTIHDNGDPSHRTTTFKASSLTTAVRASRRVAQLEAGATVITEIRRLLEDPRLLREPLAVEHAGGQTWDTIHPSENEWRPYREQLERLTTDSGVLCIHKRNGTARLVTMHSRLADLNGSAKWDWPLLRSHVLAPTDWVQPIEVVGAQIEIKRRTGTGDGVYSAVYEPEGSLVTHPETRSFDMLHLVQQNSPMTSAKFGIAKRSQSSGVAHSLTGLTVDLLLLRQRARQGDAYALRVFSQMLRLEEGDPLFFSGDWPEPLRTPLMATRIVESITPDEWSLEISTDRVTDALGAYTSDFTNAEPRAWDSVLTAWDKTPGTWN